MSIPLRKKQTLEERFKESNGKEKEDVSWSKPRPVRS